MTRLCVARHAAALLSLAACLLTGSSALAIDLRFVEIIIDVERTNGVVDGYLFTIELEDDQGQLASGTVTAPAPSGAVIDLVPQPTPGRLEAHAGPFATLQELQAMFPNGLYAFSLDGGALSGSLNFSLAAPDDFVAFSFPQHMATGIENQPTVLFSTNCTNCGFLFVTLDDAEISPDLPLGTTMFQLPMPLADGVYQLGVAAEVSQDSMPSFGADDFEYSAIFGDENRISFTVPEPGGTALAAVALVTALALRAARR